jgi:hypothetical protein
MGAAVARGNGRDLVAPEDHGAHAVATAPGQEADAGCRGQDEVTLLAAGGSEVQPGRPVDQHPRLELAVGDGLADVGRLHAGGDVPVDAAHVVAGFVGPGLAELGPTARDQAHEVAVEHAVELARHVQGQAAQDLLGRPVADESQGGREPAHCEPLPHGAGAAPTGVAFQAAASVVAP